MLDQETRIKAERLGFDVEVQVVAKALAGLSGKIVAVGLRRTDETEPHISRPESRLQP